jgi:hypothetical protein
MKHLIAIPAVKLRNACVIKRIVTVKSVSKKNRKVIMHAKKKKGTLLFPNARVTTFCTMVQTLTKVTS